MPDFPLSKLSQNSFQPIPMDDITPSPVMTTLLFIFYAEYQLRLGYFFIINKRLARNKSTGGQGLDVFNPDFQLVSRHSGMKKSCLDRTEIIQRLFLSLTLVVSACSKKYDRGLRHCLDNKRAGHDGLFRKMAEEDHIIPRNVLHGNCMFSWFDLQDPVDHDKGEPLGNELFYLFKVKLHCLT